MNLANLDEIKSYPIRENTDILNILLKDRTTNKNIIWATDSYKDMGKGYYPEDHISSELLKNKGEDIVKPRICKSYEERIIRTRRKGEVFTSSWIIEKKVDLIEEELSDLKLEEYINKKWLEVTCGEAPYITNRYDAVTGEYIEIEDRVGFLDRKLKRISEEIDDNKSWFSMVKKAYQASYGYEYQGDSLLIARENLLDSFIDYYVDKFFEVPKTDEIKSIAEIISYNIVQMDGLKHTIPVVEKIKIEKMPKQLNFFEEKLQDTRQIEIVLDEGEDVKIKSWLSNSMIKFKDIIESGGGIEDMKFDIIIGNPPYQEKDNNSGKGSAKPVYNYFVENAIDLNPEIVSLVTPSVWFTGGKGLSKFRERMLSDTNIKFIHNFETPKDIFPNVSLRGGVNYFIWDRNYNNRLDKVTVINQKNNIIKKSKRIYKLSGLDIFISSNEGMSIINKLINSHAISLEEGNDLTMSNYISARNPFDFTTKFVKSKFFHKKKDSLKNPVKIYASRGVTGYVEKDLIKKNRDLIGRLKLVTPFANNIGTDLNDDNLNSIIIEKNSIVTETYLIFDVDLFNTIEKAENGQKYLKTKFVRCLISLAKANQNGTRKTYRFVPLQDFTSNSDIDWTKPISEIDQQLYKKYGLSEQEIEFIESNVKEME